MLTLLFLVVLALNAVLLSKLILTTSRCVHTACKFAKLLQEKYEVRLSGEMQENSELQLKQVRQARRAEVHTRRPAPIGGLKVPDLAGSWVVAGLAPDSGDPDAALKAAGMGWMARKAMKTSNFGAGVQFNHWKYDLEATPPVFHHAFEVRHKALPGGIRMNGCAVPLDGVGTGSWTTGRGETITMKYVESDEKSLTCTQSTPKGELRVIWTREGKMVRLEQSCNGLSVTRLLQPA